MTPDASSPDNPAWRAPLLWVAAAMATGCVAGSPAPWWMLTLALATAALAWRVKPALGAAGLWLLALGLGGAAHRGAAEARAAARVAQVAELGARLNARFEGTVERVLSVYPRVRAVVHVERAHSRQGVADVDFRAVVALPAALAAPHECARLMFRGTLHAPKVSAFQGDWDARASLGSKGIDLQGSVHAVGDAVLLADAPPVDGWTGFVCASRNHTRALIQSTLPEDAAALVEAFVLGDAPAMDPQVRAAFDLAGASHLLAVSGLQATLLAALFFALVRALWGRVPALLERADPGPAAAVITLPAVALYAAYAGGAASVVRSAWMAAGVMVALILRRKGALAQSLGAAAVLMMLWEPRVVMDAGFQLSFLSVLALVLLTPALQASWVRPGMVPWKAWVLAGLASSAASWVATLPLVTHLFGRVAPWGLVSNVLLVPLGGAVLPLVVVLGIVGAALSWSLPLQVAGALSVTVMDLCAPFAALPGALLELRPASGWMAVAALLGVLVMGLGTRRWVVAGGLVALLGLGSGVWAGLTLHPMLRVTLVPVGQGDGLILRFPDGQAAVLDAGGSFISAEDPGARVVVPLLQRMGVTELAAVILSHPHPDHMNGLVSVVKALPVREFWFNGATSGHPRFVALMEALKGRGAVLRTFQPGSDGVARLSLGGAEVEVLHPFPPRDGPDAPPVFPEFDANDNSLVLRVGFEGRHILLPGDVEKDAEAMLTAADSPVRGMLQADVLKVPHHGSNTSSTDAFLDAVQPRHVLMGVGERNQWGFPHRDVMERFAARGTEAWRTDTDGLVEVELDRDGVRVHAFRR